MSCPFGAVNDRITAGDSARLMILPAEAWEEWRRRLGVNVVA